MSQRLTGTVTTKAIFMAAARAPAQEGAETGIHRARVLDTRVGRLFDVWSLVRGHPAADRLDDDLVT
jgi:hypothetical protein